jgi:hypothetical protein
MNHILLLGAGFSRNWGGWLADELWADVMGRVSDDRDLLKCLRSSNGFEAALEQVRTLYKHGGTPADKARLLKLQDAIDAAFNEMNAAFEERGTMEFQQDESNFGVQAFLARFDAIFTLNQDLLLERLYKPQNIACLSRSRWQDSYLPGMTYLEPRPDEEEMWVPEAEVALLPNTCFEPRPELQPIWKLHGSVKWYDINDPSPLARQILIMGGNKVGDIQQSKILSEYSRIFEENLARPKTRLMIIGYSFGDDHINRAIVAAQEHGLETFIIDPEGIKVLKTHNATTRRGSIEVAREIEQITIVGLSRRSLAETFGKDRLAWNQVMRFFRP